jgi:hypothetical protein
VAGLVLAALVVLGWAGPAQAESGDAVTHFAIDYLVSPDGTIDVTERIDYQFASSGRHGIYRDLVTRQPFGDGSDRDVRYGVSNLRVTSPDAPDDVEKSTQHKGFAPTGSNSRSATRTRRSRGGLRPTRSATA